MDAPNENTPVQDTPEENTSKMIKMVELKPGKVIGTDLIKGADGTDCTILLDVPDLLKQKYSAATSDEEKKSIIAQMLDHSNYVMTLNNKNATELNNMKQEDAPRMLNPNMISNYPHRETIYKAAKEWSASQAALPKNPPESTVAKDGKSLSLVPHEDEEDDVVDAEKKMAANPPKPEPVKVDLTPDEFYHQMKGLWDEWKKSKGATAPQNVRSLAKEIFKNVPHTEENK
jgi:GTPase SAR1 family protein